MNVCLLAVFVTCVMASALGCAGQQGGEAVEASSGAALDEAAPSDNDSSDAGVEVLQLAPGQSLAADDFLRAVDEGWGLVVDVRTKAKFDLYGMPWEAVNIPLQQLGVRTDEALAFGRVLVVASTDDEAARAVAVLEEAGAAASDIRCLAGGTDAWVAEGRPFDFKPVITAC